MLFQNSTQKDGFSLFYIEFRRFKVTRGSQQLSKLCLRLPQPLLETSQPEQPSILRVPATHVFGDCSATPRPECSDVTFLPPPYVGQTSSVLVEPAVYLQSVGGDDKLDVPGHGVFIILTILHPSAPVRPPDQLLRVSSHDVQNSAADH